ncbi:unnamed protein product [Agarophyton chilense]|eukprot:gb/GEZJ01002346.1/.p1 GENE.gb/GEZJ01002346.1/~~gb/GEZJ01002346.1/.p1  ORF type:complete len:297 (+),score=32.56 gb/GEZJ01002346.1/:337-1227(+)
MSKHAVVVGINYRGSPEQLKGCVNDAVTITSILQENGYNVATLSDSHPNWYPATYELICLSLKLLVLNKSPGDQVLFYFSGHGTQTPSATGEQDGLDEAIVTSDWHTITDNELRTYFARLPASVRATAIVDCCHSGTLFDGAHRVVHGDKLNDLGQHSAPASSFTGHQVDRFIPFRVVKTNERSAIREEGANASPSTKLRPTLAPAKDLSCDASKPDVCLLMSACQANEKCKDVQPRDGPAYGAFTKALEIVYRRNPTAKYYEIVMEVRKLLLDAGFSQNPCLECPPRLAQVPFLS